VELLKIDAKRNSLYAAFPIPHVGLHPSLHGIYNTIPPHIHIKSDVLRFHKDISPPESLYKTPEDWLEDFGKFVYSPKHNSKILVIPMPCVLQPKRWGISLSSKGVIQINFSTALVKSLEYSINNLYFLEPEELWNELPKLIKTGASLFDFTENKLIFINKAEHPLLIGYKINQSFENQIKYTKLWKNFLSPVKEAFDYIEKQYPNAINEWGSTLEKDLDNVGNINICLDKLQSMIKLLIGKTTQNLT